MPLSRATAMFSLAISIFLSACASTGATLGSGVGDAFPERSPYYTGRSLSDVRSSVASIGHLPVFYQRGASHMALFDPALNAELRAFLSEITSFVDSVRGVRHLEDSVSSTATSRRVPPDVYFGCITASGSGGNDCAERGDSALGRGVQRMRLAVGRPSSDWTATLQAGMQRANIDGALVLTLEVGQYLVRQTGLLGKKEVDLGTGRIEELPWLTSLETPVSVLQITGALVGRDGKAIRIGAEGIMAKRTPFLASAIGAQRIISEADVAEAKRLRRADLPGSPLAWQVAVITLVRQLTGTD